MLPWSKFYLLINIVVLGLKAQTPLWESYLQLGSIQRPLGLIINSSLPDHKHFLAGYLCLHSFLYDTAIDAFNLAIKENPTLVEAYIGKILG